MPLIGLLPGVVRGPAIGAFEGSWMEICTEPVGQKGDTNRQADGMSIMTAARDIPWESGSPGGGVDLHGDVHERGHQEEPRHRGEVEHQE